MSEFHHPKFHRQNLQKSMAYILDFVEQTLKGQNKPVNFKSHESLAQMIDFKIKDESCDHEELLGQIKTILDHQPKPHHPRFFNTLFGGFDENSITGAFMTPILNGSMYTYEMAPCFSIMQKEIFEYVRGIVNWDQIDGIMTPGGSFANFLSIELARYHCFPQSKFKGIQDLPKLKILVSDVSHYSFKKGAIMCGLGVDSLVKVKTNEFGQMDPEDLQNVLKSELQKENNKPFLVSATAGTTVEGAIDDITAISEVCHKYKIWLHVDAAYGGVFLLSEKYRNRLGSLKLVDSITWDPHKGTLVPLQASIFMCKYPGLMDNANATTAQYLFPEKRVQYNPSLDSGNRSLQCGRVIDVFKFWTYLKGNGFKGVEEQINTKVQNTEFLKKYLEENPDKFKVAIKKIETFNICFWCLPKNLRKEDYDENTYNEIMTKITKTGKKYMFQEGKIMVGYSSTKGCPFFWRIVLANPYTSREQMIETVNLLYKYCEMGYPEVIKEYAKE